MSKPPTISCVIPPEKVTAVILATQTANDRWWGPYPEKTVRLSNARCDIIEESGDFDLVAEFTECPPGQATIIGDFVDTTTGIKRPFEGYQVSNFADIFGDDPQFEAEEN